MLWGGVGGFRTRVLEDVQDSSLSALVPGWYNSIANKVASRKTWKHFERYALLQASAPYSTGTIAVTNGSAVVTGTGTAFPADVAGQIWKAPDSREYRILSWQSVTQITLVANYIGDDATGETYQIVYNRVAVPSDFSPHRIIGLTLQDEGGATGRITHTSTQEMLDLEPAQARNTGRPSRYRYYQGAIYLWPPPDQPVGIDCWYRGNWTKLTTATEDLDDHDLDADWPEELQEVLLLGVTARALRYMESSTWQEAWAEFIEALKEESGRDARGADTGGQMRRFDSGRGGGFLSPGVFPRRLPGS